MNRTQNIIIRYLIFIFGLAINAFGIALITKAGLGTSPISSVPYVLSLVLPSFSFGLWSFIINMLFRPSSGLSSLPAALPSFAGREGTEWIFRRRSDQNLHSFLF